MSFRIYPSAPPKPKIETEDMEWELHLVEEGENRYVVELYLAFSDDALDVIEYWALNAEPLETEKMFDEDALERVREAQQYEILEAGEDRELLAGLKIDHGNQIKYIQNLPWGRTIEYYRQWPYRREFESRIEARRYYDKLDETFLPQFKAKLQRYAKRKRTTVSRRSAPANDAGENGGTASAAADRRDRERSRAAARRGPPIV